MVLATAGPPAAPFKAFRTRPTPPAHAGDRLPIDSDQARSGCRNVESWRLLRTALVSWTVSVRPTHWPRRNPTAKAACAVLTRPRVRERRAHREARAGRPTVRVRASPADSTEIHRPVSTRDRSPPFSARSNGLVWISDIRHASHRGTPRARRGTAEAAEWRPVGAASVATAVCRPFLARLGSCAAGYGRGSATYDPWRPPGRRDHLARLTGTHRRAGLGG